MMILHMCDYRPCCNPNHLYCGDALQNAKDRVERSPRKAARDIKKKIADMYRFPYILLVDEREDKDERNSAYEKLLSESYQQISETFRIPDSGRSSLFDLL